MSFLPKKESDLNEITSNLGNSDEPKLIQDHGSLVDPSTERYSMYNIL